MAKSTPIDTGGAYNPDTLPFLDKKTIVSWDCSISMDDGASATLNVVNVNDFDVVTNLQRKVSLFLDVNNTITKWFVGTTQSFEVETNSATNVMNIRCTSLFANLEKKPINTYTYRQADGNTNVSDLLTELMQSFAGYPNDGTHYIFSSVGFGNDLELITICEESFAHALRQLAQAFGCELFVNRLGLLVNEAYKTSASAVDVALTYNHVITAKKTLTEEEGFSAVRVRGRYTSLDETGLVEVYNNIHNININYDSSVYQLDLYVQNANFDELLNSILSSSTPGVTVSLNQVYGDGKIQVNVYYPFTVGTYNINITIEVRRIPWNEAAGFANNRLTTPKSYLVGASYIVRDFTTAPRVLDIGPRYRSDKSADEKEDNRIDITVVNSTLASKYGIRWLEIDNPYIENQTTALDVANRAFTVQSQAKYTWQLDIVYNEQIDLNKVVSWILPDDTVVKGVVRKINIAYNSGDASIKMSLIVEQFIS